MPARKPNTKSRLSEIEAQKRAEERQKQRSLRWKRIAFVAVSLIVLASMILTLFIQQ